MLNRDWCTQKCYYVVSVLQTTLHYTNACKLLWISFLNAYKWECIYQLLQLLWNKKRVYLSFIVIHHFTGNNIQWVPARVSSWPCPENESLHIYPWWFDLSERWSCEGNVHYCRRGCGNHKVTWNNRNHAHFNNFQQERQFCTHL